MTDPANPAEPCVRADLAELRDSTNRTARVARGNLWLFIVVGLILGLLLFGVDDMALLTRSKVVVPLLRASVPIELLFVVGPVLFLLLHLNLLVRLNRLFHVSQHLRAGIEAARVPEKRAREAALLFPFDFLQLLFHRMGRGPVSADGAPASAATPRRRPGEWLTDLGKWLRKEYEEVVMFLMIILVVVPVFLFPLFLLTAIQMRFLPYQSEALTRVHQVCVTADLIILFVFTVRLDPVRWFVAMLWKRGPLEKLGTVSLGMYALLFLVLCPVFVWLVAVVPDSRRESRWTFLEAMDAVSGTVFRDWWHEDGCIGGMRREPPIFKRYLHVEGKTVQASRPDGAIVAAYLARGEDPEQAWRFVEELDLGGRSFRYAWLEGSSFPQASFKESDLRCARFNGARLRGANLEWARAQDADFGSAELVGARLNGGTFDGASFQGARLDGAYARGASFDGADLRDASLHGTDLSGATLLDADLRGAEPRGADPADEEAR